MSIAQILSKAQLLGVRLSVDGDIVKMKGPAGAIATIKPEIAAHKPEILAYLRDVAEFWPWAPYLGAADVERFRTELVGMIEGLADLERWPVEHRDDVLARAVRGPLADLLPNLAHFRDRLATAQAEAAAQAATTRRAWRFDR
ncbi:hypothetical protein PQR65_05235 [Paraburkholderia nemoris]|uniref:TubC N-terminal docking domain-related protein n=1 Tax=Paraburkholderia nemoris TaxID=2793076 RepID=UPI0038B94A47